MSFKFFAVGAIAALAVAGCGKDSPAGRLGDEADKQATEAQLRGGSFAPPIGAKHGLESAQH